MKMQLFAAIAASTLFLADASGAAATRTAVFAGGCFWSVEKFFEATPGVTAAVSGYSGGSSTTPTYENHSGHLEAVKVTYDPAKVSYAQLVDKFYHNIDPTDPTGQICDKGPSYRTAVFSADAREKAVADAARLKYETLTVRSPDGCRVGTPVIGDLCEGLAPQVPGPHVALLVVNRHRDPLALR